MRSLARWGSLPLLASPLSSLALGLGEIETSSYLNQPLNAEIPLTATPEEMQSLRVAMAPVAMFTARGLEYPLALNSVQFRVGRNAAGENVVFVTSRESIGEFFLTMIVQATTSRGSFNKEFTVLLDPPVFLTQDAPREPIAPPATRDTSPGVAGGNIVREPAAPQPRAQTEQRPVTQPQPQPQTQTQRQPEPVDPSGYTVQSGDTLWSIAQRYRPAGVTTNQAMLSIFEANAAAFDGNINRLRRGAILRIPAEAALGGTTVSAANAEVRRQMEEWQAGSTSAPRLVLIAPTEDNADALNEAAEAAEAVAAASEPVAELEPGLGTVTAERDAAPAEAAETQRLLEVQSEGLANVQEQAAADAADDAPAEEPVFAEADTPAESAAADEAAAEEAPAEETVAEAGESAPAPAPTPQADEPSLVDRILGTVVDTVKQPIVWGSALAVLAVVGLLAFLRRRRESIEDVTGQWEALEAEIDSDTDRAATARMRGMAAEPDMVVVEGHDGDETAEEHAIGETAEMQRLATSTADLADLTSADEAPRPAGRRQEPPRRTESTRADQTMTSQTLSSQTVINLDQADPIAEADFHMAYGLYDQAADLISKALKADPGNRALKLKLLEVYFVWGNKESFLESATALKSEVRGGADWDKVVIMGKQICPDEPIFAAATASAGEIDLDLEASSVGQGLDFAFEESEDDKVDLNLDVGDGGLSLEASGAHARRPKRDDDILEIGARTQAGLEAALLDTDDDTGATTTSRAGISDLDSTMESPTVETRGAQDTGNFAGLTLESPTVEMSPDAPTVETPTIESPAGGFGHLGDTVEHQRPAGRRGAEMTADMTAEIALDDLGLDVGDLKDMGEEVIDLSGGDAGDGDVLSATGVTKVLRDEQEITLSSTDVLDDDEATMLAPGFGPDATGIRTEVLEQPVGKFDPEVPATEDDLDLNLDDFSSALDGGAATVEQPMASRFSGLDLDVGAGAVADDDPTGTEEFTPFDPQTMTEVGTKLDLARAYIDMGDPEGAKSILEEVLSEGDAGQRSEAQALIDALPA